MELRLRTDTLKMHLKSFANLWLCSLELQAFQLSFTQAEVTILNRKQKRIPRTGYN